MLEGVAAAEMACGGDAGGGVAERGGGVAERTRRTAEPAKRQAARGDAAAVRTMATVVRVTVFVTTPLVDAPPFRGDVALPGRVASTTLSAQTIK